jgi:hypothetical protein
LTPAASAPVERAAFNTASFEDAAGDSGIAPDVTGVDVGNDVVAGPIVFWIELANRPDDLTADDGVVVLLDTDRNPATGDEDGFEYAIGVTSEGFGLSRWDGATYVDTSMASLTASFFKTSKTLRVSIHPSELGGVTAFDFFVLGLAGEEFDLAPNGPPSWSYTLATGRPPLVALGLLLSPKAPAAGRLLTAAMPVGRRDTLDLLAQGKVTCTLLVGGKPLRAARAGFTQGFP